MLELSSTDGQTSSKYMALIIVCSTGASVMATIGRFISCRADSKQTTGASSASSVWPMATVYRLVVIHDSI